MPSGIKVTNNFTVNDFGSYLTKWTVRWPNGVAWEYEVRFASKEVFQKWLRRYQHTPGAQASYLKQHADDSRKLEVINLNNNPKQVVEDLLK